MRHSLKLTIFATALTFSNTLAFCETAAGQATGIVEWQLAAS